MGFSTINKNTTFGLIILLILFQYTISYSITKRRALVDIRDSDECSVPICPRGEHVNTCICRSNEWMCADFNSSTLDCLKCDQSNFHHIKEDQE